MKPYAGYAANPNDPQLARAYCAGRKAAVAGALITTNPHVSGTPAREAWDAGWKLYDTNGTTTVKDCCAEAAKFTMPTLAAAEAASDPTGLTWTITPSSNLPISIDFGDGTRGVCAATTPFDHVFPAAGSYTVNFSVCGKAGTSVPITVTYVAP